MTDRTAMKPRPRANAGACGLTGTANWEATGVRSSDGATSHGESADSVSVGRARSEARGSGRRDRNSCLPGSAKGPSGRLPSRGPSSASLGEAWRRCCREWAPRFPRPGKHWRPFIGLPGPTEISAAPCEISREKPRFLAERREALRTGPKVLECLWLQAFTRLSAWALGVPTEPKVGGSNPLGCTSRTFRQSRLTLEFRVPDRRGSARRMVPRSVAGRIDPGVGRARGLSSTPANSPVQSPRECQD